MEPTTAPPATKSSTKNSQRAGSIRWRDGKADVRLSLGELGRKTFLLPTCKTDAHAEQRRELLADLAKRLDAAGRLRLGLPLLESIAAREGRDLANAVRAATMMANGEVLTMPTGAMTIGTLAEKWTSGELTRLYPGYIKAKKSFGTEVSFLNNHVLPLVRDIPVSDFTLDHAEEVLRRMPPRQQGTRRHVAHLMNRLMNLAVFPMRILKANPLPRGFLPPPPKPKAKSSLYPDEDRRLLAHVSTPLEDRILYGVLDREGMRYEEAMSLEWTDLDLDRGGVVLDKNKTDDPRAWALQPATVRALRAWRALRKDNPSPLVFVRHAGAAARFRRHLRAAGVDRAALFERNETRLRIRVHDLRATFVTLGLANGRTETWIADRTGHRSSIEINKYRRAARSIAELGVGDLAPLDEAIPEIAQALRDAEKKTSEESPRDSDAAPASPCGDSTRASTTDGVEPSGPQDPAPTMKTPGTNEGGPQATANDGSQRVNDAAPRVAGTPDEAPADRRARAAGLVQAWSKRRRRVTRRLEQRKNAREIVQLAPPRDAINQTKF
jgi:integrase